MTEEPHGDTWQETAEQWTTLSEKLKTHYRHLAGEGAPSEDQVRTALQTLGNAANAMLESVGTAMRDPEVRDQVKRASSSLAAALGKAISEFGDELRRDRDRPDPP